MNKLFYPKLAASNIKKNGKAYFPYIITAIITVAVFYIMRSLSLNPGIKDLTRGSEFIGEMMGFGCWIVGFFALIFLFYTNGFLMKRRRREFGLFNILGMEKRHISKVVALESIYILLISLLFGLGLGIALDKLMFLCIAKVVRADVVFGFFISPEAIINTLLLFAVIFLLVFLNSLRNIHLSKPIELLQSKSTGEREPRARLIIAILGILCLAGGYYISVTTKDIMTAITLFFVAVILVIIGTYLIFTAGSITLLKLLRKNKRYYYKTKHFLSVSGMIYRMKQNAVGLANICVLSTFVLVMLSSTTALMIGEDDALKSRFPYEVSFQASQEEALDSFSESFEKAVTNAGLTVTNKEFSKELSFAALERENYFEVTSEQRFEDYNRLNNLCFITIDEYNRLTGERKTLKENEILIFSDPDGYNYDTLGIFDREYSIKETVPKFSLVGSAIISSYTYRYIVLPSDEELNYICERQQEIYGDYANGLSYNFGIDFDGSDDEKLDVYNKAVEIAGNTGSSYSISSRTAGKESLFPMSASFFFLGIFLGTLFIMATILIIYYKQISEGYEDKERYEIMQKVGVSRREIKKSIHSQILTVFFLPLITAGIHTAFAFPIINRLLLMFEQTNSTLSAVCTLICFAAFAVLYAIIYAVTARSYYKIVSR